MAVLLEPVERLRADLGAVQRRAYDEDELVGLGDQPWFALSRMPVPVSRRMRL